MYDKLARWIALIETEIELFDVMDDVEYAMLEEIISYEEFKFLMRYLEKIMKSFWN